MDCEKCQNLLSDFLEGSLEARERLLVGAHLGACARCRAAREETEAIVSAARECREHLYSPPDSRALWLRISNTIEGERTFGRAASAATVARTPARRRGRLAAIWDRRWELTLPQMASAVAALVVSVALVTAMATQRMITAERTQDEQGKESRARARREFADSVYPGAYARQQASISYYQQRVEQRKATWNPRMRESFDRSISVIDEAVNDSLNELKQNPHDEVSEEILNVALRDKIDLLREFSEQ